MINLGGVASDDVGVTSVTWSNAATGVSGTASGSTSWSITGISLIRGSNTITVTAHDAAGNTGSAVIAVTYTPPVSLHWYNDPSFGIARIGTVSTAYAGIGWLTNAYPIDIDVYLLTPALGVSQSAFADKINGYFGFGFNPSDSMSAFIVFSIGGLRPYIAAINSVYNYTLSWLGGPFTMIDHIGYLLNETGDFTMFGFFEQYAPQSGSLVSLAFDCASSLTSLLKDSKDPLALFNSLVTAIDAVTTWMNFGAGVLAPVTATVDTYDVLIDWTLVSTYQALESIGKVLNSHEEVIELATDIVDAGATAGSVVGAVYYGSLAIIRGIDMTLSWLAPDNPVSGAISWGLSLVDPNYTTIYPGITEDGKTVLGYSSSNGSMIWSASDTGFLIGGVCNGNYFWQAFLTNDSLSKEYNLYCVGNGSATVPYMTSLSINGTSVSTISSGSLKGGDSIAFKVLHNSDNNTVSLPPTTAVTRQPFNSSDLMAMAIMGAAIAALAAISVLLLIRKREKGKSKGKPIEGAHEEEELPPPPSS